VLRSRQDVRRTRVMVQGGKRRPAVIAEPDARAQRILRALRLPTSTGLIVLNGGTADLQGSISEALLRALRDGLIRVAAEEGLSLLTGGTDAGVFRLLGQASQTSGKHPPIVGVAPSRLVDWSGNPAAPGPQRVPLEPHHTAFVLVETSRWGGETELMLELAREVSRRRPSVAVLASGGEISRREMVGHVRQGRPIVILAGTGRLADELAAASRAGGSDADPELNEIVHRGQIRVVDVDHENHAADVLASELRSQLEVARRRRRRTWRPALIRRLPRLHWTAPDPFRHLVELEDQRRYPALAQDLAFLNDHLLDAYRSLDAQALRQQNSFYLVNAATLLGTLVATVLGTVQVAGVGGGWLGFAETLLTGALGGSMVTATSRRMQRGYYTNRLKAERLRSEYFLFLARSGDYADEARRQQILEDRVLAIESMSGAER
jgi:hypothetical protein